MTDSESPENQFDLNDPQWFFVGASGAASARARAKLTEFEKLELADAEADISRKRAQVREAGSRTAMELKERETRRWITIGLALFAPAYLTAALLLAPWVILPILPSGIAAFAYLRRSGSPASG